ncbi:RteC domain-containing protein [Pontibacter liquoris]|uniref:RteC domain-containing protein n=1 Tax=Pontibacter liquoris TaxID=2905677 RepID=UPI001FA6BDBA|nr:RteC domain-containing protein [Pontibacter liquoris]
MIQFANSLYARMNEGLQRIALEAENPLQRAEQSCRAIEAALEELKAFIQDYVFADTQAEITFFKEIKPRFLRELLYFIELFYLEACKPVGSTDMQRAYLLQAMDRIAAFVDRNQWLYSYYRMNQCHLDHLLFVRGDHDVPRWPGFSLELDPGFSTLHSFQLSKLQAYEALRDHVQSLLHALGNEQPPEGEKARGPRLSWTDSKASLIELVYALRARGAVNHGKSDVKELINALEALFNIRLGNFYRVYQGMRIRKKSRTPFLEALRESLERRMDEADEA